MGTPAPGTDLLLPGMGTLCLGWRCCSQDCQPAPRMGILILRLGCRSPGLGFCSLDGDVAPWIATLLSGQGSGSPGGEAEAWAGDTAWGSGLLLLLRTVLLSGLRSCRSAGLSPCGGQSGHVGLRAAPRLQPLLTPFCPVPQRRWEMGTGCLRGMWGTPASPVGHLCITGSKWSRCPPLHRAVPGLGAQPAEARGICPRGQGEPVQGRAWTQGPGTRLLEGAAPALGGLMPSRELCGEVRGQLHRGLSCQLLAFSLASSLASLPAASYLPSLPAACPYKGTGTSPTAVLLCLRSSLAPGPAMPRPPDGTTGMAWPPCHATATVLCHGHPALPLSPCHLDPSAL